MLRKLALTAHVTTSVGWLGAVAAFLALSIVGLNSQDAQTIRASYISMGSANSLVIVPLSLAAPLTGVISSLGTDWGLLRHYWVLAKLVITIPATLVLLLLHTKPIDYLARVAAKAPLSSQELSKVRFQLTVEAGAAVLVLLLATTLSMYKPRGRTGLGI